MKDMKSKRENVSKLAGVVDASPIYVPSCVDIIKSRNLSRPFIVELGNVADFYSFQFQKRGFFTFLKT